MKPVKTIAGAIALVAWIALAACTAKSGDPRVEQFAKLPDWRGVWIGEGLAPEISGFPLAGLENYKLIGLTAPWNEAGRARVQAAASTQGGRKATGWGFPMMMSSAAPLQFVITPEETLIVNMYREVRHIHTDGRQHPVEEDRWPTTWGDSIGHWEGDTLVIDTVSVQNPNQYFFSAPPLSEQAHYTERLRMTAPDRIESAMTIEDPVTLSRPWVVQIAYTRAPELDRLIHGDFENDRSEVEDGVFTIVPPKD